MNRGVLALIALTLSLLACNLFPANNAPPDQQSTPALPPDAALPQVMIESPGSGSQAVVGGELRVRVHATDSLGITRVEMRGGGRIVASQFSSETSRDFTTVLNYRPNNTGALTLEVIAYRESIPSRPASVTLDVVGSKAELKNPGSFDPTSGVALGPICIVRPTTALSLRAGPGTNFRLLTTLRAGEELVVVGRNDNSTWYLVKRSGTTTTGWASVQYVTAEGDCGKAPVTTPAP